MAAMPACLSFLSVFMHGLPSRFSAQLASSSLPKYAAAAAPLTHSSHVFYGKKERLSSVLGGRQWERHCAMGSVDGAASSLGSVPEKGNNETVFWEQIQSHQKNAARLSYAEDARTIIDGSLNAILCTISQGYEGFPWGSPMEIATDEDGCPIICISRLSHHTKDLEASCKCTLLFMKDPTDRTDTVIRLLGEAVSIEKEEHRHARECYMRKHPQSFWVDFGDFRFMRVEPKIIHYLRGIATSFLSASELSAEEYRSAMVDPIAKISKLIAAHMNGNHAEDTQLIVEKAIGIKVNHAKINDLDRLGLNVQIGRNGTLMKLRIPFHRPAEDRKDVKSLIVQMLDNARSSGDNVSKMRD